MSPRPGGRLTGVLLAAGLLAACSIGADKPSSAGTTVPPVAGTPASVPATTTAAEPTPAPVAETSSAAPSPRAPTPTVVATDSPRPQATDVVLSFVGWDTKTAAVEAGGYLSPVVESGGTCTLQLTMGSRTVTADAPAQADASTTSCGNLAVPRSRLTPGTWTAVLRYASTTSTGTSDPATVAVPR